MLREHHSTKDQKPQQIEAEADDAIFTRGFLFYKTYDRENQASRDEEEHGEYTRYR